MNVEVLYFELKPHNTRIGWVDVSYHGLVLKCDLMYYPSDKKPWIRMPEMWLKHNKKTCYCYWPNQEISDEFQKEVLNKIYQNYDLDLQKVIDIHKHASQKKLSK